MDVFALFTDGTAEKIIIDSFPCKNNEKGLILRTTINSYDLKESAVSSVKNTHIALEKYSGNLPDAIPVCIYGFSEKVLGSSADLAFALAFISHLIKKKIITVNRPMPSIAAATGMMDERLGIRSVKGLREKVLAAIEIKAEVLYFPEENLKDIEEIKKSDIGFNEIIKKINLVPIKSLEELFGNLVISHQSGPSTSKRKLVLPKIFILLAVISCLIIVSASYMAFIRNSPKDDKNSVLPVKASVSPSRSQDDKSAGLTLSPVINTPAPVFTKMPDSTPTPAASASPSATPTLAAITATAKKTTSTPNAAVSVNNPVINYTGNTTSNISNGGFASIQGDWIYYSGSPRTGIYKIGRDGQSSELLTGGQNASCINVNSNSIYFIDKANNLPYRANADGSSNKLHTDSVGSMHVIGNWIYYICLGDNKIYRINRNGLDRTPLCNNLSGYLGLSDSRFSIRSINIYDNMIYFYAEFSTDNKKNGLYRMKLDGSNITLITNDQCDALAVDNGYIYFISNGGYIYRMDLNGQNKEKVCSDSAVSFNVNSGWIYYSNYKGIFKMNANAGSSAKLTDDYTDKINIAGSWIYYFNSNEDNKMYRIRTSGSDRQPVK